MIRWDIIKNEDGTASIYIDEKMYAENIPVKDLLVLSKGLENAANEQLSKGEDNEQRE